jgi:hypothetical protein
VIAGRVGIPSCFYCLNEGTQAVVPVGREEEIWVCDAHARELSGGTWVERARSVSISESRRANGWRNQSRSEPHSVLPVSGGKT